LRIESPTAEEIGLDFPIPSLPEGALFSYFTFNLEEHGDYPETFDKEKIEKEKKQKNRIAPFNGIYARGNGNHLIVEYFHPKGVKHRPILKSKNIIYYYDNGFNTKEKKGSYKNEIKTDTTSLNLKSGYFGNAFFSCQKDVACTTAWDDMKKAVVYIQFDFTTPDLAIYKSKGTGVLVNKSGTGYAMADKPFLITCGHLFSSDYNGQKIDIRSTISKLSYYVFYENESCNESTKRRGKLLSGSSSFNIVKIGSSFATEPNNSFYDPSEDFAIIEASKTVKTYSKLNVEYAGWDTFFDLSNSNNNTYVAIGHPGGDTKMVNVDYDRAYVNSNGEEFGLYFDEGVSEGGFSGSPIFNDEAKVVGWLCTASDSADCFYVGTEGSKNKTTCGRLDNLHYYLSSYIDPTYYGEASSDLPSQPQPTAHCSDCIRNYDETGIDCGGEDCYPCGMRDVVALKTLKDIPGPVKSRYDLIADPDPNTSLALKSGNYSFEAGMNIFLNGGFEVSKGAVFYASIENELMSEADRGCGNYCINTPNIQITPNGDGISDYWAFSQSFVTKYDVRIFDRNNKTYFTNINQPIYENGWVIAWDGTGAIPTVNTYYGTLTLYDCNGNVHTEQFYLYVTILKSAEINEDIIITNNNQSLESSIPKIKVYPNPFTNLVSMEYSGNDFPVTYKLTDLNGKLIIEGETDSQTEIINLNGFASGAYLINVKAGECNVIQKLIKE